MSAPVATIRTKYWHRLDDGRIQACRRAGRRRTYAIDVADACRARGIRAVAVTAGYVCPEPRSEFFAHMDAANVDLKGFTEGFYADTCAGHLEPVLDTLAYLKHETDVWLEITTLLIPGLNDSAEEVDRLTSWAGRDAGV